MRFMRITRVALFIAASAVLLLLGRLWLEKQQLAKVIERLSADSRIAEAVVTDVSADPATGKTLTTIKFLEYDTRERALQPKFFTFSGNVIQFQSLVIRFDDFFIRSGDALKGKSAYLFMKAFVLQDGATEVFTINRINEIPTGYEAQDVSRSFQARWWRQFWRYALDPRESKRTGIKNAQIEAPGTKFVKGILYTIRIEHDGGMRIDSRPLPAILKGEKVDWP